MSVRWANFVVFAELSRRANLLSPLLRPPTPNHTPVEDAPPSSLLRVLFSYRQTLHQDCIPRT
jgi:hypothetical protein